MQPIERLVWATDIHLNFVNSAEGLCDKIRSLSPDGLVITGDISEAPTLRQDLQELDSFLWLPTWIVLGNHDFYHGSIEEVHKAVANYCKESRWLQYLPQRGVVCLNESTALVGHEGWADGRLGDYAHSTVMLNDYLNIKELIGLDHHTERLAKLHSLGDEASADLEPRLMSALEKHQKVVVATHVPPFKEAAWHRGDRSDDMYLPHFSCKAMGNMLLRVANNHPKQSIVVLCGHTHSAGQVQIAKNLRVLTGGADYGRPAPAGVLVTSSLNFKLA